MFLNSYTQEIASTIKACYGKCGFMSLTLHNGYRIMGVVEYEENE